MPENLSFLEAIVLSSIRVCVFSRLFLVLTTRLAVQQAGGRQLQSGSTHNLFIWCSSISQRRERLKALQTKHLDPPADRCTACDNARFDPLQITKEDILRALGSSGGPVPHRLTPQHLTDLLASSTDDNRQQALWTLSTRCWQDPLGKESTPSSSAYRSVKERWQNPANLSAAPYTDWLPKAPTVTW